ncbi:Bug family tripartite tricarboxylate transporter substrate binding protein [Acidovorax sp. NCPPB 3576]|uniref:Bug family tripartite tricarboxylate transporter substrate binding protein n=1 Tax=Acidovorax sp. NCPPB 3576 TaxID=2940488 RepID=UPI002349A225|nr:tripartite tricarboxylate transporter substrate binding protein [Acidovorax sp. NCPPB 3576]WCM89692.1 tripartite tricarboxylate transporter substrate binding protein [Acidovorax sp. NCPPB 3576]
MTDRFRRQLMLAASSSWLATLPFAASAQPSPTWPSRPIRIVVAYPAGGVSDVVARALGDKLSAQLGTSVVVDNKAGAGGSIGMDAVAKAAPDGYTLGFSSISPLVLNPHLGKSPFDPAKDIVPVASVMVSPVLLLGTPASQAKDFRQLLASAKARPGEVRWATSGLASLGHIMLEQIMQSTQVQITHVPYKGGGQQLNDALSGQFEVLSTNAGPAVMQHIQAGKLRALAVGAPARLDSLPDVPTLAELGIPAANVSSLFGVFAPARTPAPILERLNAEINSALALPDFRARLEATDNVPQGGKATDFAKQIAEESQNNARIIRAAGIQMN